MSAIDELRALPGELKLAAGAAVAMVLTLLLPWYQKNVIPPGSNEFRTTDVTGLAAFSFVEGAYLLVAAGVLYLVWARARRMGFHLPGGDGFVISLAGAWALALVVWRMFDQPTVQGAAGDVGIRPGILAAALAAGGLIAAGARVRAAHRPEPPNPAADEIAWEGRPVKRRDRPSGAQPLSPDSAPPWEGEPPEPPVTRR